jgi:uncharacterized membrane protein YkoI
MKYRLTLFLICLCLFSCEEQFKNDQRELSQKIIDNSFKIFPGEIIEQTSSVEGTIDLWKISIINPSGAIVSFYWQKGTNLLFKIDGEKGPFTYELNPQNGVISLSTARFLAYESYAEEDLVSWNLSQGDPDNKQWVYEFILEGQEKSVLIDAYSGNRL